MEIACRGGFFSAPIDAKNLEWHCMYSYKSSDDLKGSYKNMENFLVIAKNVSKKRFPEYKQKLSSALSARKREAVDGLLRDLGYPVLNDIS